MQPSKAKQLKIIVSESLNPRLNLATEEWIFHHLEATTQILFLWRNESTVVIGRNQNPWSECNLVRMKEDNVHLARRTTGGGAVFHDLGNTNFTFLSPKRGYDRGNNIQIILDALATFGVKAEVSGRNDLVIAAADGPRKFSGSAYREKQDRAFHHGTLLLHADLSRLGNYLTPNPKKLKAKGKESVRARVMNLDEIAPSIDHNKVSDAIIRSFENFYRAKAELEILSLDSLQEIPSLKAQFEELSSWEWLYGKTLPFNHQMSEYVRLGFFDFHFQVDEGMIVDLQIFSDCLLPGLIDDMQEYLKGKPYHGETINKMLAAVLTPKYGETEESTNQLNELGDWLIKEIEI